MENKKKTRKTKETIKKVTITFYLPEAEHDYICAQNGLQWSSKMYDLYTEVRGFLKHGDTGYENHNKAIELLEKVKFEISSIAFPEEI